MSDDSTHSVHSLSAHARQRVDDLAAAGLGRELRAVSPMGGCRVRREGAELISFASCDYLGLAAHPRLAAAAAEATAARGTSSGSARLLVGHCDEVAALESELATFFAQPAAESPRPACMSFANSVRTLLKSASIPISRTCVGCP